MPEHTFNRDQFMKSAGGFRAKMQSAELIGSQVRRAMTLMSEAAISLVVISRDTTGERGPLLTARVSESNIQITGGDRNVILSAACGAAFDYRLKHPRSQLCGQILVFGHLNGHDTTELLSAFRVYANGDCSDGNYEWSMEGGSEAFLPYLAMLAEQAIFDPDSSWPGSDKLLDDLRAVPVFEDQIDESQLRKPCFGFECAIKRDER